MASRAESSSSPCPSTFSLASLTKNDTMLEEVHEPSRTYTHTPTHTQGGTPVHTAPRTPAHLPTHTPAPTQQNARPRPPLDTAPHTTDRCAGAAYRAPRIKVCRNGDAHTPGRPVVLNRRVRSLDALCNHLTASMKTARPVERLLTPGHGTRITSLGQLREGTTYVAACQLDTCFKKLDYDGITDLRTKEREHARKHMASERSSSPRSQRASSGAATSSAWHLRNRQPSTSRHIFLAKNGDSSAKHTRLLLRQRRGGGGTAWEVILQEISDKLMMSSAVRTLYTVDGERVCSSDGLQTGGTYVAVARGRFKRMAYRLASDVVQPKRVLPAVSTPPRRKKNPPGTNTQAPSLPSGAVTLSSQHPMREMLSRNGRQSQPALSPEMKPVHHLPFLASHCLPRTPQPRGASTAAEASALAVLRAMRRTTTPPGLLPPPKSPLPALGGAPPPHTSANHGTGTGTGVDTTTAPAAAEQDCSSSDDDSAGYDTDSEYEYESESETELLPEPSWTGSKQADASASGVGGCPAAGDVKITIEPTFHGIPVQDGAPAAETKGAREASTLGEDDLAAAALIAAAAAARAILKGSSGGRARPAHSARANEQERERAATVLQAAFRGSRLRRQIQAEALHIMAKAVRGVILLQARWRGVAARRKAQAAVKAKASADTRLRAGSSARADQDTAGAEAGYFAADGTEPLPRAVDAGAQTASEQTWMQPLRQVVSGPESLDLDLSNSHRFSTLMAGAC